ncbi:hypothetical protein [Candidatus Protofrankia californiensis]|uniref:hypothetical protein n=1 Tax=Candidatus Protofrankia californiensis TaxID=1839754 RepID=UPI001041A93E|nr:hypothetical protein [Candidatus Protofrankia californiensis]
MPQPRRLFPVTAYALVAVMAVVLLLTPGCGSSDSPGAPAANSPAPTPTADPTAPVWGFLRSDEAAPAIGVPRVPASEVQAGSWQFAAATRQARATVIRRETGRYSVIFPRVGVPGGRGAAVVSAVGDAPVHCHTENWAPSGLDEEVTLACRSLTGAYVDSRFTALFTFAPASHRPNPSEPYAYFRDDAPSQQQVRPENSYSLAGPGTIEINWTGIGHYSIDLIGALYARTGNNLQVNAVGSTTVGCSALGREVHPDRQTIFVGCADGQTWTDAPFVVVYGNQHTVIPVENAAFGHSFSGLEEEGTGKILQPPLERTVDVWPRYSANSAKKTNTIRHVSTGIYEVVFPGVGRAPDHVQVTPYGEPTRRCAIAGWTSPPAGEAGDVTTKVVCFDPDGSRADSQFSLAYVSTAALAS